MILMVLFWCVLPPTEARFDRLSVLNGLSQSQVLAMVQDRFGFMWLGTQDGLNRYDGYSFQVFRSDSDDHPIPHNHVQALLVDRDNVLWVGTKEGGLLAWDLTTNRKRLFRQGQGLASDHVGALLEDSRDRLWVGTQGGGVQVREADSQAFLNLDHEDDHPELLAQVHCFLEDDQGTIWVGGDEGLHHMPVGAARFARFTDDSELASELAAQTVFALAKDRKGRLWVGTLGGGLYGLDLGTGELSSFRHHPQQADSLSSDRVWSLLVDRDEQLWVGTMEDGLNRFREESGTFQIHKNHARLNSLSSNKIWSLFEDQSGLLWIGTGDHGVNKLNKNSKPFHHVPALDGNNLDQEALVVTAVYPEGQTAWLGTWGQGLFRLSLETGRMEEVSMSSTTAAPRLIVSILPRDADRLWLGIWQQGLVLFDLKSGAEQSFCWDFGKEIHHFNVTQIHNFGERLLLTTYGDGVLLFDPSSKTFEGFQREGVPVEALSEGRFFCAQKIGDQLWLGSMGKGLFRLNLTTMALDQFQKEPQHPSGFPADRITALHAGSEGLLWVGTDGHGLLSMGENAGIQRRVTTKNGLPSNVVNGILEDGQGRLWVATNKGIDCYDPVAETHQTFDPGDGVQLEFNAGVYGQTRAGYMFFGGPKGMDYFDPLMIRPSDFKAPVVFSGFKVFNRPNALVEPINVAESIALDYTQNFFAIEFAAMDFANPGKNRFAVMLEGLDRDWIYNGTRNYKEYTNLSGGSYTFRVKGANADGVWNEVDSHIRIVITPPFWKTSLFLVPMGFLLLGVLIWTVHYFEQKQVKILQAEQRKQVELNLRLSEAREVERLRIAQEIHDGPIQDLHAIQFQLSLAGQYGEGKGVGTYLLNVISNLRRLCGHLRPPALVPFGLAAAIRSHVDALKDQHPQTAIRLNLQNDGTTIQKDMRLALFRICQEGLNNALQHAQASMIEVVFKIHPKHLNLEITDNGRGFVLDENLLRFSGKGHYGLLGISERAQAVNGKLMIHTAPGGGTSLRIVIPKIKPEMVRAHAG